MNFWINDDALVINENGEFVLSEECPCNRNFYIVGYCLRQSDIIEEFVPSGEYHIGDLNTLYILSEDLLWTPRTYFNDKVQYSLAGPFKTSKIAEAELEKDENTFLATLNEKCKGNSLTILFNWTSENGCDFDIKVDILNESYGYGHIYGDYWNPEGTGIGKYGHQYGDDTGCAGFEKVSINRNQLIKEFGNNPVEIIIKGHWWSSRGDGNVLFNATSTSSSVLKTINVVKQYMDTFDDTYDVMGKIIYYPNDDAFEFIGS